MKDFLRYLVVWISENLSIPFWIVGHIHLTVNIYEDLYEILASLSMNIIVFIGFFISYKEWKRNKDI